MQMMQPLKYAHCVMVYARKKIYGYFDTHATCLSNCNARSEVGAGSKTRWDLVHLFVRKIEAAFNRAKGFLKTAAGERLCH